ncbi:DUF2986 domain-containing protein [Paraferrimonas sp. SM1919]|uniref:DUF2986 domain-containing protein n=1 Tax=Paraferrimonas sp. SM1919 TaxID=2662263 RepID=UPI0013D2588D|nr:DUF2986 domain-containing protein [Paraferrimonas sp. SM1919]
MNRKKKVISTLKKKLKKQNAKLNTSNKPKYISKAERAAMAATEQDQTITEDQHPIATSLSTGDK